MPAKPSSPDLPKLAQPAVRALNGAGITTLAQLARHTEAQLRALHGMGPSAIKTLKAALKEQGLSLSA